MVTSSIHRGRFTLETFAALPDVDDYELVSGRLVRRDKGNRAALVTSELAISLGEFVDAKRLGWVLTGKAGFILSEETVRRPSVSFIRAGRLPGEMPSDTFDRLAPDLAVEILSPFDTKLELRAKVNEYLAAGVRLAWLLDLNAKAVEVYRPGRQVNLLSGEERLTGEDVVPGFACIVRDIFASVLEPAEAASLETWPDRSISCTNDEDTRKVLEVVAWCLKQYFGHNEDSAVATVERYYTSHAEIHDDHLYQQEGAYWMALRIHFVEDLKNPGDFHVWRVANGYTRVPNEVGEFFHQHFFEQT